MKDKTSTLWVMMNMAMTADGKTSGPKEANGFPKTPSMSRFSSKADHRRLLQIRATTDAVMSGRATVESDAIDLGPGSELWQRERCRHGREACNKRIVVSASGRIQPRCLIYQNNCSPLLIATTQSGLASARASTQAFDWIRVEAFGEEKINLKQCMHWLQKHWQVRRLVVEGGGHLNDAMFRAGLVDELFLTLCPLIYGGRHHATIADGVGFTQLSDAYRLRCVERKRKGCELFLRFVRERDREV